MKNCTNAKLTWTSSDIPLILNDVFYRVNESAFFDLSIWTVCGPCLCLVGLYLCYETFLGKNFIISRKFVQNSRLCVCKTYGRTCAAFLCYENAWILTFPGHLHRLHDSCPYLYALTAFLLIFVPFYAFKSLFMKFFLSRCDLFYF